MGRNRLSRGQQVERNREQLLAAARRVFVERGFHAASLDAIADAAGFSKGVVYSQFASKADLFLALLEQRIEERAAENDRLASATRGRDLIAELVDTGERSYAADPAWALLLIEFRVHAARDPLLNARYAKLHARTVARLAATIAAATGAAADAGSDAGARAMPEPATSHAIFMIAVGTGLALERIASTDGLPDAALRALAARALGDTARGEHPARTTTKTTRTRRPAASRVPARSTRSTS